MKRRKLITWAVLLLMAIALILAMLVSGTGWFHDQSYQNSKSPSNGNVAPADSAGNQDRKRGTNSADSRPSVRQNAVTPAIG